MDTPHSAKGGKITTEKLPPGPRTTKNWDWQGPYNYDCSTFVFFFFLDLGHQNVKRPNSKLVANLSTENQPALKVGFCKIFHPRQLVDDLFSPGKQQTPRALHHQGREGALICQVLCQPVWPFSPDAKSQVNTTVSSGVMKLSPPESTLKALSLACSHRQCNSKTPVFPGIPLITEIKVQETAEASPSVFGTVGRVYQFLT